MEAFLRSPFCLRAVKNPIGKCRLLSRHTENFCKDKVREDNVFFTLGSGLSVEEGYTGRNILIADYLV